MTAESQRTAKPTPHCWIVRPVGETKAVARYEPCCHAEAELNARKRSKQWGRPFEVVPCQPPKVVP